MLQISAQTWSVCVLAALWARGSDVIGAEVEQVVDLGSWAEKNLRLTGRFELLHLTLSSARRLVRILRSVVQSLVLAMLNAGHDPLFRHAVAGELIS
jgi:hypothetical protein